MSQEVLARGPKIILLGVEGTGKTDAIRTLIEAGLKVFVVFSEPGMEVLLDSSRGRKVYTCEQGLHWRFHPLATPSWQQMSNAATLLNTMTYKTLSEMAPIDREKYRCFLQVVETMGNLVCERCNGKFGPADSLPYDEWCVVNDSFSTMSKAALLLHIGAKPGAHQGEYGNAMQFLERYVDKFCGDMPCMGVMLAHVDVEPSPETGGADKMIATLGQKLAPKVGRPFSDVILAKREGANFKWSTIESGYRLKTRNLPFSGDIPPSFRPIVESWKKKIEEERKAKDSRAQADAQIAVVKPPSA